MLKIEYQEIFVECPFCQSRKKIKIPSDVFQREKSLTVVSIPTGVVCDHKFQTFVDKNFKVRGYQKIDFKISRMEFLEKEENLNDLETLPFSEEVFEYLRNLNENNNIWNHAFFIT